MRSGLIITPSTTTSEPGAINAATIGKAADEGSAGTTTGRGLQFGAAGERDPAALALRRDDDLGAEMGEHLLGVVARGLRFDRPSSRPRAFKAGEQHRRLDLRRGDRRR